MFSTIPWWWNSLSQADIQPCVNPFYMLPLHFYQHNDWEFNRDVNLHTRTAVTKQPTVTLLYQFSFVLFRETTPCWMQALTCLWARPAWVRVSEASRASARPHSSPACPSSWGSPHTPTSQGHSERTPTSVIWTPAAWRGSWTLLQWQVNVAWY